MDGIGTHLRAARLRLGLTLREVEDRTSRLAQQWGNRSYCISASWLDRVERENRGLSATKLIVLAFLYNLTMEQMLALCPGVTESPAQLELVASPNTTLLLGVKAACRSCQALATGFAGDRASARGHDTVSVGSGSDACPLSAGDHRAERSDHGTDDSGGVDRSH